MARSRFSGFWMAAVAGLAFGPLASRAQSADSFLRGRQIALIVGYNPGGSYDLYSTLVASALPRYLPGAPTVTVKYMPGVGGLKAANYLMTQGSRDGLTIGMISQAAALRQVIHDPAIEYDVGAMGWIGRLASSVEATVAWHTSPARTLDDATRREVVLAATSAGSTTDFLPRLMNLYAGARFRIVKGYPGTTGAMLAMERGEVEGAHATIDDLLFAKADWRREGKVSVLVQYALRRHAAFPDVPAMVQVGKTEEDRRVLELFGGTAEVGRALVAPPGVPADRLAVLRRAFDAMVADAVFRGEVGRRDLDLQPLSGGELQTRIAATLATPAAIVAKAAAAMEP